MPPWRYLAGLRRAAAPGASAAGLPAERLAREWRAPTGRERAPRLRQQPARAGFAAEGGTLREGGDEYVQAAIESVLTSTGNHQEQNAFMP